MSLESLPRAGIYSLLFDALNEGWVAYGEALKQSRRKARPRMVHDLRTSIRRLVAVLELVELIEPRSPCRDLRSMLKIELDSVRNLRDYQIELKRLTKEAAGGGRGLLRLVNEVDQHRKIERQKVEHRLGRVHARRQTDILTDINRALLGKEHTPDQERQARKRVIVEVKKLYERARTFASRARPSSAVSLHQTRIRIKRYRYAREAVEPVFAENEVSLESSRILQEVLGEVQDTVVLLNAMKRYLGKFGKNQDLERFERKLRSRRESSALRFVSLRKAAFKKLSFRPK